MDDLVTRVVARKAAASQESQVKPASGQYIASRGNALQMGMLNGEVPCKCSQTSILNLETRWSRRERIRHARRRGTHNSARLSHNRDA
jgi:hypothetical protein